MLAIDQLLAECRLTGLKELGYRRCVIVAGSRLSIVRNAIAPRPNGRVAVAMTQLVEKVFSPPRERRRDFCSCPLPATS